MTLQLSLDEGKLKDFETFIRLGPEKLIQIINVIKDSPKRPLRLSDLQSAIKKIIPDRIEEVDILVKHVLSLHSLKRKLNIDAKELFDALYFGIQSAEKPWPDDKISKWKALEPVFLDLLSLPEILYVAKVLSLSYDYDNLSQSIKILTDIRPVYNEDAKEIVGTIISHTLRLYYQSPEGSKSISFVLDREDISKLLKSCERALTKADTAKFLMKEKAKIETFISGEEE